MSEADLIREGISKPERRWTSSIAQPAPAPEIRRQSRDVPKVLEPWIYQRIMPCLKREGVNDLLLLTEMGSRGVCCISKYAEVSFGVRGCWKVVE